MGTRKEGCNPGFEQTSIHPLREAEFVAGVLHLRPVARIIRHHHERFDGTGYPDALGGQDIPLGARVLAVASAFYAMTADPPYGKGTPAEAALAQLGSCAGTEFDPRVVEALLNATKQNEARSLLSMERSPGCKANG